MAKEKLKIELDHYWHPCQDGCCDIYGTTTTVNGKELLYNNQDTATIVQQVLEHLGYDVEVIEKENGEEV